MTIIMPSTRRTHYESPERPKWVKLSSKAAKDAVDNVNKHGGESSSNMNKTSCDASEAKNEQRGRSVKTVVKTVDRRKKEFRASCKRIAEEFQVENADRSRL